MKTALLGGLAVLAGLWISLTAALAQTQITAPKNFTQSAAQMPVELALTSFFAGNDARLYMVDDRHRLLSFDPMAHERLSDETVEVISSDWPYVHTFGGTDGEFYSIDEAGKLYWNRYVRGRWQLDEPLILGTSDWNTGTVFGGIIREDGSRHVFRVTRGGLQHYRMTVDPRVFEPGEDPQPSLAGDLVRYQVATCFLVQFRNFAVSENGLIFALADRFGWDEVVDVSALNADRCLGEVYSYAGGPDLLDPFMRTEAGDLFVYKTHRDPLNESGVPRIISRGNGVPVSTEMADAFRMTLGSAQGRSLLYTLNATGDTLTTYKIEFDVTGPDAPAPGDVSGWRTDLRGSYQNFGIPMNIACDRGWWGECHTQASGRGAKFRYGLWCGSGHPKGDNPVPGEFRPILDTLDQACWHHDKGYWKFNARTCGIPDQVVGCPNNVGLLRRLIQILETPKALGPDELAATEQLRGILNGATCVLAKDARLYPYYDPVLDRADIVINGRHCCEQVDGKWKSKRPKCWRTD